jgi:hypothetical protein
LMNENISSHISERMNMNEGRGTKHDRSDDQYSTTEERAPKLPFSQDIKTINKNREPKRSPSQDSAATCVTAQGNKAIKDLTKPCTFVPYKYKTYGLQEPQKPGAFIQGTNKGAGYYHPFIMASSTRRKAANRMWKRHYQEAVTYSPRRVTNRYRLFERDQKLRRFCFIDNWANIRERPELRPRFDTRIYSLQESEEAKWVMQFYRSLGNPGIDNLKGVIRNKLFKTCPITIEDIEHAELIFGQNWDYTFLDYPSNASDVCYVRPVNPATED